MYHLRGETTIARPIADVFAFLSDMENDPLWCSEVRETRRISEGEAGEGRGVRLRGEGGPGAHGRDEHDQRP